MLDILPSELFNVKKKKKKRELEICKREKGRKEGGGP
jgi:hypothetical protein